MRYLVIVRKGRMVVEQHRRDDYDVALELVDTLEENLPDTYSVEFRDTSPFSRV